MPTSTSTQDELRSSLPPPPSVLAAEIQTHGHGRQGKSWVSSQPQGLWVSILLQPQPPQLPPLSLIGAMATLDAIRALVDLEPSIKWPNDLLIQNRKVAGLLVETVARPKEPPLSLLGLGLNLHQRSRDFPEGLKETAISLRQASGRSVPRAQALAAFLDCLDHRLSQLPSDIMEDVRASMPQLGRTVKILRGAETLSGQAEKLDDAGHLHLRLPNGEVRILSSGETDFPA